MARIRNFICASATIANPKEHAERLIGEEMTLIDRQRRAGGGEAFCLLQSAGGQQAAWHSAKQRAGIAEAGRAAAEARHPDDRVRPQPRAGGNSADVFAGAVKQSLATKSIRGYRGGYLPKQRREIERGLSSGEIRGVVSTNALELGIDIGQLQACVLNGYPGRSPARGSSPGRAGDGRTSSVTFLVASSNPLDQYMIQNPDYFFEPSAGASAHPSG